MKTLIISSGFHPVTNGMGGAIENLIETYLIYNDIKFKNDIILYSVKTHASKKKQEREFFNTKIRVIDKTTIFYKLKQIANLLKFKITKNYNGNVYIKEVIKDLKRRKELQDTYDCIIVENIGKFVPILKKVTKSKIVLHLHNDYLNKSTDNAEDIIKNSDNIWCVSKFICNKVKEVAINDKEKSKVKLLYNGIDLKGIRTEISNQQKEDLKKKYGIKENEKVILYVGRLMPEKGIKELLLGFKKISKEREDVSLLIVGGTREIKTNKDKFVAELKRIAKTISNNKVIFTGNLEYNKLYEVYSIADIQVVPSIGAEAFGLTVIEGMTYAIPLITTNSGGIPEIVEGDYELMVDTNSDLIDGIYMKLNYVLNNSEKVEKITNNYPKKLEEFTNENYCENFNFLMNKI